MENEWYVYLGWILGIISAIMMVAIIMVRKPPYEYEPNQFTIVYADSYGTIFLLPAIMRSSSCAEGMLRLYEDAYREDQEMCGVFYNYSIVGVIKGKHKWKKNYGD